MLAFFVSFYRIHGIAQKQSVKHDTKSQEVSFKLKDLGPLSKFVTHRPDPLLHTQSMGQGTEYILYPTPFQANPGCLVKLIQIPRIVLIAPY